MSKWQQVKLGELYDVHNGLSKSRDAFGTGYPFLSFSEVFNNYFLPNKLEQLVESTQKEQDSYSIHRGDVFITRTSETMDELGMSCVALHDYPNATYNGFTKRLRPKYPDRVLPEYIGYFLRTPLFRSKFVAFSTMTTRASLRNEDLLTMEVTLPPKEIQRKIADVLSAYDDLIENNRKQIKLLEEAAQRLYREWFIDLRFPGHETTPIIDGIPEGWEKKKLENICPIVTGKRDANFGSPDGEYLFFTCSQEPIKSATYSFDTSAVILAGNGDFNVKLYRGKFEAYQRTYVLSPQNAESLFLLFGAVRTNMRELTQKASGSTIKFLTRGMIADIEIFIPNDSLLIQYNVLSNDIQKKMEYLVNSIKYATEARDRLLPKLITGELEVEQCPQDL